MLCRPALGLPLLLSISGLISSIFATPTPQQNIGNPSCTHFTIRKSWQSLTPEEKTAYIQAELCLQSLPADLGLRGARSKFDELLSIHVALAEVIHLTGQFLAWHRNLVYVHEHQLQTLCGYQGAHPYWDEAADVLLPNFMDPEIFDPVTGFGGDGQGQGGCIVDGPFASYSLPIGPGYELNDHCISRNISSGTFFHQGDLQVVIQTCMGKDNFVDFWHCIEPGPHIGGHGLVMGVMADPISSPGDSLFYLHHCWIDKLWADWQNLDPSTRYTEIGGNNQIDLNNPWPLGGPFVFEGLGIVVPPPAPLPVYDGTNAVEILQIIFGGFEKPPDIAYVCSVMRSLLSYLMGQEVVMGDTGAETTLSHVLQSLGILPDVTIGQVMDTTGPYLCYQYDT